MSTNERAGDGESVEARSDAPWQARLYPWVLGTWLRTRVIAVACIFLTPRLLDDVDIYRGWVPYLRWEQFPLADPKWQYPPGAGVVLLAPDVVHINYSVAFVVLALTVDAAIMALLLVAHHRRVGRSARYLWLWAVAALVVGPIMYTRFDIVPALFAVAFVLVAGRPVLAGMSAALGFVVKLWPFVLVIALPRHSWRRGLLSFAVSTAVVLVALALRFDGILSFLGNQRARGLQVESTGALPYELWALVGGKMRSGLEYGSYQVLMPGAELAGTVVFAIGVIMIVLIAWWRFRGRLDNVSVGDVALTLVLVSVVTSRVYSPQYNIWLVAVAAVALLDPVSRMRRVAALVMASSILTQVIYPWFPYDLTDGNPPVVLVQALRIIALVAAAALAFRAILHKGGAPVAILGSESATPAPARSEESWTSYPERRSR